MKEKEKAPANGGTFTEAEDTMDQEPIVKSSCQYSTLFYAEARQFEVNYYG